jgi:GDP-4-dehydro-6-deoxy-D-mannose reductase
VSDAEPTLVTGAAGFVGSWLVPELTRAGTRVIGAHKPGLLPSDPSEACEWLALDVRDAAAVAAAVKKLRPAFAVHLAGLAVPRTAEADPAENERLNVDAAGHLASALAQHAPAARLLHVSTGAVYGGHAVGSARAKESDPLAPRGAYARAKARGEERARAAAGAELDLIIARPFNHTGPGRPADYAESSFARQIAALERAPEGGVVRVGNLEPLRDVCDVRDVVRAYRVLLERGTAGSVYNVCSGNARPVRWLLDRLVDASTASLRVEVDPERYQAAEPETLCSCGDPTRLRALGWQAEHALEDTLAELLDYWRSRS